MVAATAPASIRGIAVRSGGDRDPGLPPDPVCRAAASCRRSPPQSPPCACRRLAARGHPDRSFDRVPARPSLANGRRDRADAGAAIRDAPSSSRMDDGGAIAASPRLDLLGFYRGMAGGTVLGLFVAAARARSGAIVVADSPPIRIPLAGSAGAGFAGQPIADPRASGSRSPNRRRATCASSPVGPGASSRRSSPPRTTCCRRIISRKLQGRSSRIGHRRRISAFTCSPPIAARDFGWAGTMETVERLEATFASMQKLRRFKGHFFNWYGTHRSARARSRLRLIRRQRQSGRSPDCGRQRLRGVDRSRSRRTRGVAWRTISHSRVRPWTLLRRVSGEHRRQLRPILDEIEAQLTGAPDNRGASRDPEAADREGRQGGA